MNPHLCEQRCVLTVTENIKCVESSSLGPWLPPPENLQCQRSWDLKENKFEGKKIIVHENEQPLSSFISTATSTETSSAFNTHTLAGCHSRIGLTRVGLWCQLWNELNATSTSKPRTNYRLGDDQLYLKICVKIVFEMYCVTFLHCNFLLDYFQTGLNVLKRLSIHLYFKMITFLWYFMYQV